MMLNSTRIPLVGLVGLLVALTSGCFVKVSPNRPYAPGMKASDVTRTHSMSLKEAEKARAAYNERTVYDVRRGIASAPGKALEMRRRDDLKDSVDDDRYEVEFSEGKYSVRRVQLTHTESLPSTGELEFLALSRPRKGSGKLDRGRLWCSHSVMLANSGMDLFVAHCVVFENKEKKFWKLSNESMMGRRDWQFRLVPHKIDIGGFVPGDRGDYEIVLDDHKKFIYVFPITDQGDLDSRRDGVVIALHEEAAYPMMLVFE